ncbi:unnamed protein product [Lymnaea stagnalis]|uniref:Condensin complex subunit 1 n=1 Tax=Lymnaea stagnalis TaxID=6523 RepID=A0AAV2HKY3_LYMST
METFPDLPVFAVLNNLNKKSNSEDDEEDSYQEPDVETKLEAAIKEVFFWVKSPLPPHTPDSSMANSTELDEPKTELAKQQTLVNYLKNSLTFALQVQQCIPVVCQLLGSKNTTDVLEAIHFFVTAVEFGVSAAVVGVRRMMVLIWSQEATVRDAVVDAYRTLYLEPKDKNQRFIASSIVKNLSGLVVGSTCGDLTSLEALVTQFVKSGHIGPQVIKALWERFNDKSNAVSEEDARAAVHLIAMCAQAEPDIVKSNVEVLIQEGLGTRAENDYLLALGTCTALLKITSPKEKGKLPSEPFRFEADNSLFERLKVILVKGMTDANTSYWIPLADQAVRVIYELSETPDEVCVKLLRELTQALNDVCSEATQTQGEGVPEEPAKSSLVTCMLTRLLAVAGQVAFKQTVYMEDDVLTEMKRRLTLTEDNKKGRRKSRVGAGNGSKVRSKYSEMEEDMALAGASAEDTEAEFIRKLCEMEILSTDNFLSGLYPLIIGVCSNSAKFSDPDLQTAATLALARFMIVSSQFCESQLQLLFTLLEKSPSPVIRSNLIIALGDLTFRFPNLVEPWTSHLYARLRDDSSHVRKTTLQVLTHLILNDMVKVKGQISELATCIVDPDDRISGLAKLFFHELAKKGTSMYNMPDIISRLSDPDIGVEENNFHIIIKYIFSHIEKSKHCESLTEKLCHRFRATRTDRQVRDLSFCLSQLTFSEKAISKLLENFQCYADKLVDNDVYGHFCQIISKSRQFIRPEAKVSLEELEKKIEQAHTKGLEEGEIENKASKSSVVVKGKTKVVKPRNNSRQKNKSNKENINENEDDETDIVSPLKPKRTTRGNKSVRKPRYTLDSDEEDDEALFDIGREGEYERDLDDDDSLLTKPSQKRSKKGKVSLTPLYSPAT